MVFLYDILLDWRRRDLLRAKKRQLKVQYFLNRMLVRHVLPLFSLLMNKRCIVASDDDEILWTCCPLLALTDCTDISLEYVQSVNQTSNQTLSFHEQETKQSINPSSNLVNKVNSVTQLMTQQQHQASNASMYAVPCFASSPGFPSDWSTFRVSLLKHQISRKTYVTHRKKNYMAIKWCSLYACEHIWIISIFLVFERHIHNI